VSAPAPVEVHRDGAIVRIVLADPARANALSPAMVAALGDLFARDWRAEGVRALLLAGAGRHFSAGADLAHLASLQEATPEANRRDSEALRALFESLLRQEVLTVALVHGACVAGGCGLATACDFVVAAEGATFQYTEVRIGFVPALVATFLPLRVRGSDLRELLLHPRPLAAAEALAIGLVNRVVPAAELASAGLALADEILAAASPEAIARTKRLLLDLAGQPLATRLDLATAANAEARATADCRRGIATFLADKRTPDWRR